MLQDDKQTSSAQEALSEREPSGTPSLGDARRPSYSLPFSWIAGVLLFVLALSLNLYRLGTPSIWFDEAFSVELARQPFSLLWRLITTQEPNMGLYHLFLHAWLAGTSVFGWQQTEVVVRLPSVLFAALSTVVIFQLARRTQGLLTGVVASALFLLNDWQLVYAQQARAYSLQILLLCLSWYALFMLLARTRASKGYWVLYVVSSVLAIYTHLFSVVILGAQLVAFGGLLLFPGCFAVGEERTRLRGQAKGFLLCFGLTLVLGLPMLLLSGTADKTGWLPPASLSDLIYFLNSVSGNNKVYLLVMLALVILVTCLALLSRLRPKEEKEGKVSQVYSLTLWTWLLLCWFVLPIVGAYIVSQGSLRLFSARYLVVVVPALVLLMAFALGSLFVRRWRAVRVGLVLCVLALAAIVVPFYYRSAQVEDWNSAASWVQERFQAGDGLVCYDNSVQQGCQVSMEYYLHAYPGPAHFEADTPGAFSWEKLGPARPAGPDEATDPAALQTFASKHTRIFYIVGRVRDDAAAARAKVAVNWLESHYHLQSSLRTRTVEVYLFSV